MLSRFVDIREGEHQRSLLAFVMLLLVVASYTIVKSVRDALFLSRFGITQLCFIAIGLALLTGFVVSFYLRKTEGVPRPIVIGWTNAVVVGTLALIWLGLFAPPLSAQLPWVLYVASSIFGVFTVMQFWLLANDLFDPRQAKRLFGLVGAGAIVGGVVGGVASRALAQLIGTRNLLLVAAGMLIVEAVLVFLVWPLRRREERGRRGVGTRSSMSGGFSTVRGHGYTRLLAYAVIFATVSTTLLGWQFMGIAKATFGEQTDEMTAFFGSLSAYLSIASFGIQTLLTGGILRRFGVSVGLMALPCSLLVGSGLVLNAGFVAGLSYLMAASIARVAEGGMRFAVDRASMELMWVPVPARTREQGKAFVDTVMDRVGTGVAGLIWLALALIGFDKPGRLHLVSFAIAGVVIVWLFILSHTRRAYVGAFRDVLSLREIDLDGLRLDMMDAEAQRMLAGALASSEAKEVSLALYVLEDWQGALPNVDNALRHSDPTVAQQALRLLTRRRDTAHRWAASACLTHVDEAVREAAVIYLRSTAPDRDDTLIGELAANAEVDGATIHMIRLGVPAEAAQAADEIAKLLKTRESARRVELVQLLGAAPPEVACDLLRRPLQDHDATVVRAAIQSAGRSRATGLLTTIIDLLEDWRYRRLAVAALRSMGRPAVEYLAAGLREGSLSSSGRKAAVRVVGRSGRSDLGPLLMEVVSHAEFDLSRRALRGLTRLADGSQFSVDGRLIDKVLDAEFRLLVQDLLFVGSGSWADIRAVDRPPSLLRRALCERADQRVERIFSLLSLRHDANDIRAAYRGVRSPLLSIRASAIEFLDNVLDTETKIRLLPLLETGGRRLFESAVRQQGTVAEVEDRLTLLRRLLQQSDLLLQAVAAWTVGEDGLSSLRAEVSRLGEATEPLRGVARRAVQRLDAMIWEEPTMGLTALEKALKLQRVDVLQQASTDDLMHIAQIAEEMEADEGTTIYREGDAPDALFVVLSGSVRLHRDNVEIAVLGEGEAFGSWALVDEAPRVASASAAEPAMLLRVGREEFVELLADRVDIVQAVFRAMVARLRDLAGVSSATGRGSRNGREK